MKKPKISKAKNPTPWIPTEKQIALKKAKEERYRKWEHKRKLEEEANKIIYIPPKDLTEQQLNWINRNCQPKIRKFLRSTPIFSRWAKQGPMTRSDWIKFYKWADIKAEAKKIPKPFISQEVVPQKKRQKTLKMSMEQILEDIEKLANPKLPREKYQYPAPINYPYSPKIDWFSPPKHDRGRPFPTPKVPMDFQHIELEIDFWSKLRFPVRSAALKYKPSENILSLAQPLLKPPLETHCPIPPKPVEYIEPRKRMSKRQWREHKRRLEDLARPVSHPVIDIYY